MAVGATAMPWSRTRASPAVSDHRAGRNHMGSMRRWLLVALALGAVVASGCGGDSGASGGGGGGGATTGGIQVGDGKPGGAVTILASGDVDYLDPGQMYYTFAYEVQYAV